MLFFFFLISRKQNHNIIEEDTTYYKNIIYPLCNKNLKMFMKNKIYL